MSARSALVLALVFSGGLIAGRCVAAPLDDLEDCADRVEQAEKGRKLAELCPQLKQALAELGFDRQLDLDEKHLGRQEVLNDLVALGRRYAEATRVPGPATRTLAAIAEQVNGKKTAEPVGWWDRVWVWIRHWFEKHAPSQESWLDQWLKRLGAAADLATVVMYVCMGLVVVGALIVIFNELRLAGVFTRPGTRASRPAAAARGSEEVVLPGDSRSGVARLLAELVTRLLATGRLRAAKTLTHRELIQRALLDSEDQKQVFARVALAAEALTYGPTGTVVPEQVMEQGMNLLAQMGGAPLQERS